VPRLTDSNEANWSGWLWAIFAASMAVGTAQSADWLATTFWLIVIAGMLAVWRLGQAADRRTLSQRLVMLGIGGIAIALVVIPVTHDHAWRAVGVALTPIPFLIDIALARRRVVG
jgi:hypothetical protein